ncbi:hypothetical protein [Tahibacter aquaticus]|nr:hypothetical protein [Tahibacter aquaticus]
MDILLDGGNAATDGDGALGGGVVGGEKLVLTTDRNKPSSNSNVPKDR